MEQMMVTKMDIVLGKKMDKPMVLVMDTEMVLLLALLTGLRWEERLANDWVLPSELCWGQMLV